jgi:IclR family transcriptional regulator, KDG regulon repressor
MSDANSSNAVERALSILEIISETNRGMSNSDLSRRLEIPKSSASYILRVLEKRNYLQRDEGGKYRLGLKLVSLTRESLTHLDIREIAKPILEKFLQKSRLAEAHLAVLDNGRAVYIEKAEAKSFVKMDIWVGHRLPIHTTAIGKALTAYLPDEEVLSFLNLHGMEKKTDKTITSKQKFLHELRKTKKDGFAIDNEENAEGVRCVAAPVFDESGKVVGALGTSTIVLQLNESQLPKVIEMVKDAAESVSQKLGYSSKIGNETSA